MAMSERFEIELPPDLAAFVHAQIGRGALASRSDVLLEAVRIMQQRDAKLHELRAMVDASIAEGGNLSDEEVRISLEAHARSWRRTGS